MNLKDWQAMSLEEQKAHWESATLAQRRELDDAGLSFADRPHPGIEIRPGQVSRPPGESSPHCCAIRDTLIKQLKDEEDAVIFYSHLGGELALIGEPFFEDGLSDITSHISDDEFRHYIALRGLIDILTEQCNCQRKTLGPPFG